jgi:hypothetical protein
MIYDTIDEGGHKITMVAGMILGKTTYWCEDCGALFIIKGFDDTVIFQEPDGSPTKVDWCSRRTEATPLKDKLDELHRQDYERTEF